MMLWRCRGWRFFLVCFGICFLSLLAPFVHSSQAQATSDPITVTSQTTTIRFPQSIDFQLSANDSSSPIVQATIVLKVAGDDQQQQTLTPKPPTRAVTLHWHKATTGNQFEPVGTFVTYYWVLRDQASNVYMGALQTLTQVDTRFNWQHLSQGDLQVNWYNRPQDFGQAVLQEASKELTSISANLGGRLQHPINLWIYQNINDFHSSLPPATHEWVGGIAFPTLSQASLVIENLSSETLKRDMPHEMTHLVFHQLTARGIYAPTWFDEGLAVYNQLYHEPAMTQRLQQALKAHTLLRLNDITMGFPADADKAYLAYAQSWNLVGYMYATFGKKKMAALILALNTPNTSFNQDLVHTIEIDQAHLENQWHLSLGQPSTLTADQTRATSLPLQQPPILLQSNPITPFLLTLSMLLIALLSLGIVVLLIYQRRCRAKIALAQQAQRVVSITVSLDHSSIPMSPYRGPDCHRPSDPSSSDASVDTPAISEDTPPGNRQNWQPPFPKGQNNFRRPPDTSV
jgi:hypothetical protein